MAAKCDTSRWMGLTEYEKYIRTEELLALQAALLTKMRVQRNRIGLISNIRFFSIVFRCAANIAAFCIKNNNSIGMICFDIGD